MSLTAHRPVLDHLAVAAERQTDAWSRYIGDLGGAWVGGGVDPGFGSAQVRYANGMKVEVLEPHEPARNDFLRRFLDRNGPGPHHLTYKVADIRTALDEVAAAGYSPVGVYLDSPVWKEAFLHPKEATGVVIQLAQSAGDWEGPPRAGLPVPRPDRPATLVHVAHAVADLDEGLRLFAGLLRGHERARGDDEETRWVDLDWDGGGRVRLLAPSVTSGPLADWIEGRPGRVHHAAFSLDSPAVVADAIPLADGTYEVPPATNLGLRLILHRPG